MRFFKKKKTIEEEIYEEMPELFTDGWSDLEDIDFKKHNWKKIFIINKHGRRDIKW